MATFSYCLRAKGAVKQAEPRMRRHVYMQYAYEAETKVHDLCLL